MAAGMQLGMGSALETPCGQAYGAGPLDMLGVYMQRSWVIILTTTLLLTSLYVFAAPLLRAIGQAAKISEVTRRFALWMLPQLFAYAANFPIVKFLQAQSRMLVMAVVDAFVDLLLDLSSPSNSPCRCSSCSVSFEVDEKDVEEEE